MAVLLEGHVLDYWGQLVVVSNQDHPLQTTHPILLSLHSQQAFQLLCCVRICLKLEIRDWPKPLDSNLLMFKYYCTGKADMAVELWSDM